MKERLDVLMVQKNLAGSREKAKALIMSGIVYVNGQKEDKAGTSFDTAAQIEVRGNTLRYVSLSLIHISGYEDQEYETGKRAYEGHEHETSVPQEPDHHHHTGRDDCSGRIPELRR